ncbi:myb-like dna-binding domain containing protein [Stylonychia lemnae]|uniref:Myb-like dna-binding domain containing protein n=1 Tax=Stylonychia lemnae TaxID=5949 RepID=A0A077ZRA4_STYLE|nr:myb-like dna-binding domain containing protein [Stylonychia lemnae]|eukprot:CDW71870.1 myb-like dna-binding domain containing protein [Stylonychia lemnae]
MHSKTQRIQLESSITTDQTPEQQLTESLSTDFLTKLDLSSVKINQPKTNKFKCDGYFERMNQNCISSESFFESESDFDLPQQTQRLERPKSNFREKSMKFFRDLKNAFSLRNCDCREVEEKVVSDEVVVITRKQKTKFNKTETKNMRIWTKDDDQYLLLATQKYAGNWKKISEMVATKTAEECLKRALQIKMPQNQVQNKLHWSEDIDRQIIEGYKKYGANWKLVSKNIPSKTSQQVKDRFNNVLKGKIKAIEKINVVDVVELIQEQLANQNQNILVQQQEVNKKSFPQINQKQQLDMLNQQKEDLNLQKQKNELIKKVQSFTKDEDQKLLRLANLYHNDWIKISKHFVKKPAAILKERFTLLSKVKQSKSSDSKAKDQRQNILSIHNQFTNDTTLSLNSKLYHGEQYYNDYNRRLSLDIIMEDPNGQFETTNINSNLYNLSSFKKQRHSINSRGSKKNRNYQRYENYDHYNSSEEAVLKNYNTFQNKNDDFIYQNQRSFGLDSLKSLQKFGLQNSLGGSNYFQLGRWNSHKKSNSSSNNQFRHHGSLRSEQQYQMLQTYYSKDSTLSQKLKGGSHLDRFDTIEENNEIIFD